MSGKIAFVLSRHSKFYPTPVQCCVVEVQDQNYVVAMNKLKEWEKQFVKRFPEFQEARFTIEEVEMLA